VTPIGREIEQVKAIGIASVNVLSAVILVAIVAVVLSSNATVTVIQTGFQTLAWLVSLVMAPLKPGSVTDLSSPTEAPTGGEKQTGIGGGSLGPLFGPQTSSPPGTHIEQGGIIVPDGFHLDPTSHMAVPNQ
jgi:hypothetical protein